MNNKEEIPKQIYLVTDFDEFDWVGREGIYWSSVSVNDSDIKYIRADLVEEATNKIIDLCSSVHSKPYDNLFAKIIKIAEEIK